MKIELVALPGIPRVQPGDDLVAMILQSLRTLGAALGAGDILVLAQKIVSKAEGRRVGLSTVTPSARAIELGSEIEKDPRLVQLVLDELKEVLRHRPGVIIVEHRLGFILANAGIDASNVDEDDHVLLLPLDPNATCARLRAGLKAATGADVAVIINDSFGRAWRNGTIGTAIGLSGLPGLLDLRGQPDLHGRPLRTTELAVADEVAAAASLLMGQADEGRPIVLVRGFPYPRREGSAEELIRQRHIDLFR